MTWSRFWIERGKKAAVRRKRRYGLEPPPAVAYELQRSLPRLGFMPSLRLAGYVIFGTPKAVLRLFWCYLSDRDTPQRLQRIQQLAEQLRSEVTHTTRVLVGSFERANYGRDLAVIPRLVGRLLHRNMPHLVVQPRLEGDVIALMKFAGTHRLGVFPRGVGSSAFGASVPTANGIVVDFSQMSDLLELDIENQVARVQPGIRWADLARDARSVGLVPSTTPSSLFSTVGGWVSTGGLGLSSFGYGPLSKAVVGARVVLPDGTLKTIAQGSLELADFIGTEAQFGVFTELSLLLRPCACDDVAWMGSFAGETSAFTFIEQVIERGLEPDHVVYYDSAHMAEENRMFSERTGLTRELLSNADGVLLHFDREPCATRFTHELAGMEQPIAEPDPISARYLWTQRTFPLKAQRLGPNLLAAENRLERRRVPEYIERARLLARRFGTTPSFEVYLARTQELQDCVVIASFTCDSRRRLNYLLRLLLVQLMSGLAVRMGGFPYGVGIWYTPFVARRYTRDRLDRLIHLKNEVDPHRLMNPNKFFRYRTRFFNVLGLAFRPAVFAVLLGLARLASPLLGGLARLASPRTRHRWRVPEMEEDSGQRLLRETAIRCTSCGACISTCPAYLLTGDELVTGRGKLRMAEALSRKEDVSPREACRVFQCLRCGLCEEVCQTRLPLRDCYLALERWIEERFEVPSDLGIRFAKMVDDNRDWIARTYGLDLPDWSPIEGRRGMPAVRRINLEDAS